MSLFVTEQRTADKDTKNPRAITEYGYGANYNSNVGTEVPLTQSVDANTGGAPAINNGKLIGLPNIKDAKPQGADALGKLYNNYNYNPDSIKKIFQESASVEGKAGINSAQGVLNSADQGYTQQMALARAAAEKERNSAVMSGAASGMQALAGMDTQSKADQVFAMKRLEALQGIKTAQDKQGSLNAKAITDAFTESQNANKQLMTTDSANYAVDATTQQAKLGYDAQVNAANTAGSATANNTYGNIQAANVAGAHNENSARIANEGTLGAADLNAQSYMYSADQNYNANSRSAEATEKAGKAALLAQIVQSSNLNLTLPADREKFRASMSQLGIIIS